MPAEASITTVPTEKYVASAAADATQLAHLDVGRTETREYAEAFSLAFIAARAAVESSYARSYCAGSAIGAPSPSSIVRPKATTAAATANEDADACADETNSSSVGAAAATTPTTAPETGSCKRRAGEREPQGDRAAAKHARKLAKGRSATPIRQNEHGQYLCTCGRLFRKSQSLKVRLRASVERVPFCLLV
jgi:hypothetical protein